MKLLHSVGDTDHPNYNTREQILESWDELGFDGIYLNVYENMDVLEGKNGIFFVMGDYIGEDNKFDLPNVPKLEQYCTMAQIREMMDKYDFKLGWHTWTHRDLTKLSKEEIMDELKAPFETEYIAYPYGTFNDLVVECARESGYTKGYSVTQGNGDDLTLFRDYL